MALMNVKTWNELVSVFYEVDKLGVFTGSLLKSLQSSQNVKQPLM